MIRFECYPVMDGLELWMHGTCNRFDRDHIDHKPERFSTYISREDRETVGDEIAVSQAVERGMLEFPEIARRASC